MTASTAIHRFLLRLPATLHERLRDQAHQTRVSLNELCVQRLAAPGHVESGFDGLRRAVSTRVGELFETRCIGAIVFGSWAREEAGSTSDVDILVIIDRAVALTRGLYQRWDDRPLRWEGRAVDVHFTHLPDEPARAGVWCDTAIDGIVLFDPSRAVHQALTRTRQAIADGRILRRTVHGHPYWVQAA